MRFLEFSLSTAYNIDLKYCNIDSSSPASPSLLYAPPSYFYGSNPLVFNRSSTSSHIYSYNDLHNYSTKLLAHRSSSTTSEVVLELPIPEEITYQKELSLSLSYCLLCLPFSVHFANLLQCKRSFHHPLCGTTSVLHITQTNKIAYPCIPYNGAEYILAARM